MEKFHEHQGARREKTAYRLFCPPASPKSPELSEIEFGLIIATHAFNRWMIRCMSAAGVKDMTLRDVLVMHHINHRDSAKRLADICFVLNIEDTHVVSYSVKKLIGMKLVAGTKRGKEVFLSATKEGAALCERYRKSGKPAYCRASGRKRKTGALAKSPSCCAPCRVATIRQRAASSY